MFVVDTNVLSALMPQEPTPEVPIWIAGQPLDPVFTSSVKQSRILSGPAVIPEGRRRGDLGCNVRGGFQRSHLGRPAATSDLMVTSIARSHRAGVVTRDVEAFQGRGLAIIIPWDAS